MPPSPLRQKDPRSRGENGQLDRPNDPTFIANGMAGGNGSQAAQAARERRMHGSQVNSTNASTIDLAPLEPTTSRTGTINSVSDSGQRTAASESSVGLGDNERNGSLHSYQESEVSVGKPASARPAPIDSAPPLTPERSKRRPPSDRSGSVSTVDLRPAPLTQARKLNEEPNDHGSKEPLTPPVARVTSNDATDQGAAASIRPLNVQNKTESPQQAKPETTKPATSTVVTEAPPATKDAGAPVIPTAESPAKPDYEEQFRPGLGPMIRKQMVAERFKKAASAANAFKPRAGGAAEKILKQKAERDGEPDGITGVVPRPMPRQEPKPPVPAPVEPVAKEVAPEPTPVVDITPVTTPLEIPTASPARAIEFAEDPQKLQPPTQEHQDAAESPTGAEEMIEQRHQRQAQLKVKRRSAYQEKNLAALEIDSKLLEGQGIDFEVMLSDFGWTTNILKPQQLIDFERDIRRELGRVEAGSWLSQADSAREERVTHVENLLDKAIEECDELEGLLTLYSVELSSLNEDIAFIEAQSQGLQVQSANQKLLQSELQSLVDTMSLDRRTLDPLQHLPLNDVTLLEKVEYCVSRLYQAMLTIDPTLHSSSTARPGSRSTFGDNETSNMVALRQKKGIYEKECAKFSQRLLECLESKFAPRSMPQSHV